MSKNLVSFLIIGVFLTGCQGNVKPTQKSQPVPKIQSQQAAPKQIPASKPPVPVKASAQQAKVVKTPNSFERVTLNLIAMGEEALAEERFLTPVDDNANLYFQAALGRDPGNVRASQGISAIVDVYTQWAWKAAQSKDYAKSALYLEHARSVNPGDPVIAEMSSRIKSQRGQMHKSGNIKDVKRTLKEGQYALPSNLFSLSENEIIARMQPIIDEVAKTQRSIVIYWPNDKEARLIYQIINSRVTEFRVRAMTYHRADNIVELQQD